MPCRQALITRCDPQAHTVRCPARTHGPQTGHSGHLALTPPPPDELRACPSCWHYNEGSPVPCWPNISGQMCAHSRLASWPKNIALIARACCQLPCARVIVLARSPLAHYRRHRLSPVARNCVCVHLRYHLLSPAVIAFRLSRNLAASAVCAVRCLLPRHQCVWPACLLFACFCRSVL